MTLKVKGKRISMDNKDVNQLKRLQIIFKTLSKRKSSNKKALNFMFNLIEDKLAALTLKLN